MSALLVRAHEEMGRAKGAKENVLKRKEIDTERKRERAKCESRYKH